MNSEIKLLIYFSRFERKQAKKNGAPERTRTSNHQNRNLLLYPLSYGHSAQLFYCTPLLKSSPTKNRPVLSDISSGSDHSCRHFSSGKPLSGLSNFEFAWLFWNFPALFRFCSFILFPFFLTMVMQNFHALEAGFCFALKDSGFAAPWTSDLTGSTYRVNQNKQDK